MRPGSRIRLLLGALGLLTGAARFGQAALIPAARLLLGDFRATFPTLQLAWLRPDFPTAQVWPGWTYGPVVHLMTLPLFLAPTWSWVGPIWAAVNLVAVAASFIYACRLSGAVGHASITSIAVLAGLWLWFKPLQTCFADGNIELVELALTMCALVAVVQGRSRKPGVLLGVATMIKFAPVGFLGWLAVRRQWRAVWTGVLTIAVIALLTQLTLGWQNSGFALKPLFESGIPQVNADTQSVVSLFLHRAGVLDYSDGFFIQRWFPTSRAAVAAQAGGVACLLLAGFYGLVLLRRAHRPVSPFEVSVLFIPMLLLLSSNHQYYYVFALVPISVLFLRSVVDRQWSILTITIAAYFMMSAPFRFTWIDRAGWFKVPFFYVLNYRNVMLYGALALWATATYQMFSEPVPAEERLASRRAARRTGWIAVPAALVLAVALFAGSRHTPGPSTTDASVDHAIMIGQPNAIALSPDGQRIAYIGEGDVLCTRLLMTASASTCWQTRLAEEAAGPFFSPDGRWIGFFSRGTLRKVPAGGGDVETINGGPPGQTAVWEPDDTIVFAAASGIIRFSASGRAAPEQLVAHRPEDGLYLSPTLTPAGDAVVFTIAPLNGSRGAGTIVVQSLKTGRRTRLVQA